MEFEQFFATKKFKLKQLKLTSDQLEEVQSIIKDAFEFRVIANRIFTWEDPSLDPEAAILQLQNFFFEKYKGRD